MRRRYFAEVVHRHIVGAQQSFSVSMSTKLLTAPKPSARSAALLSAADRAVSMMVRGSRHPKLACLRGRVGMLSK